MRTPLQIGRLAACALCALAAAGCGGGSKPRSGATSSSAGSGQRSGAALQPVFAQSVVLQPVSGTVRIRPPASAGFTLLQAPRSVALGTEIDTRSGVVKLTAANPAGGKSGIADFQDGVVEVLQSRSGNGLTDLRIQDTQSAASACRGAGGSRQLTSRQLGLLLGDGTGQFRTEGDFASATVRGTAWGVRNRCDGTLTVDRRGTVVVTDFRLRKTVTLQAGETYLAKAS